MTENVRLTLNREELIKLISETHTWLMDNGIAGVFANSGSPYSLLSRWISLQLAIPGAPGAKNATLPETRKELAEFFGDIHDPQGRMITGYFVEMALQYLTMTEADSDLRNVRPDHRHAVEEAFRKAERGFRELRDVMDGTRTYDEKGHVS